MTPTIPEPESELIILTMLAVAVGIVALRARRQTINELALMRAKLGLLRDRASGIRDQKLREVL
jgi:hypothetical protein